MAVWLPGPQIAVEITSHGSLRVTSECTSTSHHVVLQHVSQLQASLCRRRQETDALHQISRWLVSSRSLCSADGLLPVACILPDITLGSAQVMPDDVDPHDKTAAELARVKGKGKLREIQEEPPEAGVASDAAAIEIDDLTCAICLEQMKTADTAIIKGCGHSYCGQFHSKTPHNHDAYPTCQHLSCEYLEALRSELPVKAYQRPTALQPLPLDYKPHVSMTSHQHTA